MSFFGFDIADIFGVVPVSLKSVLNIPSSYKFNHEELFLEKENIETLIYCLFNKNVENGIEVKIDKLKSEIPRLAKKWASTQIFEEYDVEGPDPITDFLRIVNRNFFKDHAYLYAIKPSQETNPIRQKVNGLKPKDMLFDDLKNMDYATPEDIIVTNKIMRYGNKYPINQVPPPRHLDKRNEGLRNAFADDASKVNPVYGYDMTEIYRRADEQHDTEYRDFPFASDFPGIDPY